MEYTQITENVGYIKYPVNIGVIRDGKTSAILVDTGLDSETARKTLNLLAERGMSVTTIINTHSHADHIGGNRYIQEATGALTFAPAFEAPMIEDPFFEPFYLFSGASPLMDLKTRVIMAAPSRVDHVIARDETRLTFDEVEMEIIPLPGHSINQIGVKVDGVFFCGDSFFSHQILEKYRIPYFTDVDTARETMKAVKKVYATCIVPSHAEPGESLTDMIDKNLKILDDVETYLAKLLAGREKSTEEIFQAVCARFRISLEGIPNYYLMRTTLLAYLSMMKNKGAIDISLEDNRLCWKGK